MNQAATSQSFLPPTERLNLFAWARKNLFSTWYDSLLTILAVSLIYLVLKPLIVWIFTQAEWEVIKVNLRLLMTGQYPVEALWRAWLCMYLLAALIGLSWGIWGPKRSRAGFALLLIPALLALVQGLSGGTWLNLIGLDCFGLLGFAAGRWRGIKLRRAAISFWVAYFPIVLFIIRGSGFLQSWLPEVPTNLWGGLMLTIMLTVVGIVFSFPLGVLLALGRRSTLPAIRWVSVIYIELIRGVPLVSILFMASVMVPLFLPGDVRIDRVLRTMVGITMFTAAYLAENVRGGLQAIPRGQFEASQAVGLSSFHTMLLVVLPQALRTVIPVIMGLFIALFKDTSLVVTIGLLELLGISRSILAQPDYIGYQTEVLLFISLIYWVLSYFLSYVSRRLEVRLGVGER